jgi:cardiolipin synthase
VSETPERAEPSLDRIATIPNLLSLIRILLIPVFVALLLHPGTEQAGLVLLGVTAATDWVDGFVARRTGQVSNVGKLLDPVADRLALIAALVTLVVVDAVPLWAALLVVARDVAVLIAGAIVLARYHIRIDVRWIGKIATFALMVAIPSIAWANFGLAPAGLARVVGWTCYWIGIVLYYVAALRYAGDVANARRGSRSPRV